MGKKITDNLSIIDKEFKIEGSVSCVGKLIIKGQITGTIDGDVIIIAEEGRVTSTMTRVSSLTIGGKFTGNISASKELIILSGGICSGKVECLDLIVENGGILNAEVCCKNVPRTPESPGETAVNPAMPKPEKQIKL